MRKKPSYRPYGGRKKPVWLPVLLAAVLLFALGFAALEILVLSGGRTQVAAGEGEPEVMVIFGCKVNPDGPSVLLRDRLDTALAYLADHPDMTVVVTGGKGDDEHVSEAQAMYDYLVARGVDGDQILREDRSRNTWQNVNYTMDLLAGMDRPPDGEVLLVSSGFHLARIGLLWDRARTERLAGEASPAQSVSTLAAPASHLPSRVQMFFREPFALVKSFLFDR